MNGTALAAGNQKSNFRKLSDEEVAKMTFTQLLEALVFWTKYYIYDQLEGYPEDRMISEHNQQLIFTRLLEYN